MKKVLALVFSVLFLSVMLAHSVRAEGLLSDFFEMIKNWFESSPLGNLFATPVKRIEMVKLGFYPQTFEFDVADFVNVTKEGSEIINFKGHVSVDTVGKIATFQEAGSSLSVKEAMGTISVKGVKFASFELRGMKLYITSGNWNETSENGSVVIKDFLGDMTIKEGFIEMEGNVSKLIKG